VLWNFLLHATFGTVLVKRSEGGLMQQWGEKYRELARECFWVASTTITAEGRSLFVEMARVWTRLADEQNIRAQQQME
jgi:hypothetical protein